MQMFLKSIGVDIKPEEITQIIEQAKVAIPAVVQTVQQMDARMQRIEAMLQDIIGKQPLPVSGHGNGAGKGETNAR